MGLESVNFISDLVPTWPLGTDKVREGDNHIRNIKKALKNTLPNFTGQVTVSHTALNGLPANFATFLAELLTHVVPKGAIIAWGGQIASIPVGWALCDGSTVIGYGAVPDLRDRFLVGAGNNYVVGATGGAATKNTQETGNHVHTVDGTILTANHLPAHSHRLWSWAPGNATSTLVDSLNHNTNSNVGVCGVYFNAGSTKQYLSTNVAGNAFIETTGVGEAHTHGMQQAGAHVHEFDARPPYYALAFIIKTSEFEMPT